LILLFGVQREAKECSAVREQVERLFDGAVRSIGDSILF
jgi:hypothetical protein